MNDLSVYNKVPGTLTINDVAHAFFLMKAFVAYPKNYGGIKFSNISNDTNTYTTQSDNYEKCLKDKERHVLVEIWNLLQP